MPAIDTDDLSAQFVGLYRDNVFCAKQKVLAWFRFTCILHFMTERFVPFQVILKYAKIILEATVLQMTGMNAN